MNPNALRFLLCALLVSATVPAWAVEPKETKTLLDQKAFFKPELYLSSSHVAAESALAELPNRAAWEAFLGNQISAGVRGFVDPRSGTATNIIGAFPLIPGSGAGNRLTTAEVSRRLRRRVTAPDAAVVGDAVLRFVSAHRDVIGIDTEQLGEVRAVQVTPELWQVSIPQRYQGVPVRHGRLAATISHGNLVLLGTETWGNVQLDVAPRVSAAEAEAAGFAYVEGRDAFDLIRRQPALEIVPFAPQQYQHGEGFRGPIGAGYGHRLVWAFSFQRPPELAEWEVLVDAHSGEVLALEDLNRYVDKQVTGGVYPLTNTEICPDPTTCGIMQLGWPMPYANTGLPAPNNFANGAGLFNYTSGSVTSTLNGRYVRITDTCGTAGISSPTGDLLFGGANAEHDCASPTGGLNTAASRSGYYELNRIAELARGWLPTNTWLQAQLTSNMNINQTCNAFWGGGTVNFYRSGGGCRNTGEIAGVFDHEWGHGIDDNDAAGILSSSSEAYADIAAIYRLETSCVGHGFTLPPAVSCGLTVDGTGRNANEARVGPAHCNLDCSGVRDSDWDKHADHTPDTPINHNCPRCDAGSGPCGRQVHCSAAPVRQAAWDLVARDLRAAPFNLDSQTAFLIGNKLFYQGSGNVGSWHACDCTAGTSDGCGATNGYMQWIAADDDNGNLADGTPHMAAIHAAFNRHGIACATPTPQNAGCAGFPSTPATLSGAGGNNSALLNWTSVTGANRYWVFRTEGHAGCNFGKTRIADLASTATTFTDTEVANGRSYYYNVVAAAGSAQPGSSACFGRVSNCLTLTPQAEPDFALSCPASMTVPVTMNRSGTCTLTSVTGFSSPVTLDCTSLPAGVTCDYAPNPATPPANGSTISTLTISVAPGTPLATHTIQARGTSGSLVHSQNISLTIRSIPNPDFSVAATPATRTVKRGRSTTYTVNVTPIDEFTDTVALSVTGLPSGAIASFSPASLSGGLSTMNISTARNTARGTFTLTVVGTSGTKVRTATVSLTVTK
jgi:trimeric autotransporter adhesin